MEIKKSYKADLDHWRPWLFLLGLLLASALFFLVLNVSVSPPSGDVSPELLEEIAQEMELKMKRPDKDLIPVFPPEKKEESASEKLNVVDVTVDAADLPKSSVETDGEKEEEVAPVAPIPVDEKMQPLQFRVVEQLPEFPGGMVEFMKWLTKNLKYPPQAKRANLEGRVVVSFIVNVDGTTTDARVVKSAHPLLDAEAMRVLRMMPEWKPGEDHGKPCRTMLSIPIVFKI